MRPCSLKNRFWRISSPFFGIFRINLWKWYNLYICPIKYIYLSNLFSASPLILGTIEDIEISRIRPFRYNYRQALGDIDDLSRSIDQKGLLQPILVKSSGGQYYEIIACHRRYQACRRLGWRRLLCHIIELDDKDAFEISLIENIQRQSLNPVKEATAYKRYMLDIGWGGISELALRIGKSVSHIDKRIRLLDLPVNVVEAVSNSSMKPSTAEELLAIKDKDVRVCISNLVHFE